MVREDANGETGGGHKGSGHVLAHNVQVRMMTQTISVSAAFLLQAAAQGAQVISRPRVGAGAEAGRQQADAAQHLPGYRLGAVDTSGESGESLSSFYTVLENPWCMASEISQNMLERRLVSSVFCPIST